MIPAGPAVRGPPPAVGSLKPQGGRVEEGVGPLDARTGIVARTSNLIGSRSLCGSILAIALLAAPGALRADEPGPAALAAPPADAAQIEHYEYWQARGEAARARVAEARAELDEADAAVSRMRRRNHPRGEARIRLREQQAEARAAYEAAVRFLEVDLPAEAEAAGGSRRWLRERRPVGR